MVACGNVLTFKTEYYRQVRRSEIPAVGDIGIHNTSINDEGAVAVHSRKGGDTTRTDFIRITEQMDKTEI